MSFFSLYKEISTGVKTSNFLEIIVNISFGIFLIAGLILLYNKSILKSKIEEEELKQKNDSTLGDSDKESYFNKLVKINLDNLSSYYILVKRSAGQSFFVSLLSGLLGFLLLSLAVSWGLYNKSNDLITIVSIISGIIIEFISGTFFYLYNKTVRQMKEYHDSLVAVQNMLLCLKLIEDTKSEDQKLKLTEILINQLATNSIQRG